MRLGLKESPRRKRMAHSHCTTEDNTRMRVTKLTATWIDHRVVPPSGIARSNRALATIRSVTSRIESAFAAFANIPYQDAPTQQEIVCLLEEFKVDSAIDVEGERSVEARPSSGGSAERSDSGRRIQSRGRCQ